jgi:succinate-semialdehyde dehydrogenase/glutarate-semialdehyde dehydrogenase
MPITTTDPATGELVRAFPELSSEEIRSRIALARAAFEKWRRTTIADRAAVVRRAGEILDTERDTFGRMMTLEMGKPLTAAIEEAAKCAAACRFYADHAEQFLAREPVTGPGLSGRDYIAYRPIGIVLAVMPWNFPFWQVMRFAAPALVAGNVGLLKHASNVPQCALAIEDIFRRAGAPEGVFQSLLIGSSAVAEVIAHDSVAAVTLTGSEGAGSTVGAAAGKALKKSVLELGGSDPFIVMPSADIALAASTAVKARTINNGQSCIAAKRFIVHEKIADDFTRRFVDGMRALRIGDPMNPDTQIGPLALPQLVEELEEQVRETVRQGGRVLLGGQRLDRLGNFFAPTVIVDVPAGSPAARDEMFGPVAAVFRARDAADAIRIANDSRYGLGASAWTADDGEAQRFASEIESGQVFINSMVISDPRFPFGGVKRSGYGRELSEIGLREFVNIKTVRFGASAADRASNTE